MRVWSGEGALEVMGGERSRGGGWNFVVEHSRVEGVAYWLVGDGWIDGFEMLACSGK